MTAKHRLGNNINTKAGVIHRRILVPEFGEVDNLVQLRADIGDRVWI